MSNTERNLRLVASILRVLMLVGLCGWIAVAVWEVGL